MSNSPSRIVISSVLILMLYFLPNLMQDAHRMFGHQNRIQYLSCSVSDGLTVFGTSEKCNVCMFEFNFTEKPDNRIYTPFLLIQPAVFVETIGNYPPARSFPDYNLRAPPFV